ncbi:MAG: NTP/NDP exchange transporter [Chlamydiae bacterium]|nr:NTP/NDP exchange transporter [Chlamydiota bacterium]
MSSLKKHGTLRSFLWPIHREELRVFIPMLIIFFTVGFSYNVLRVTKDALVVTAPSSGAEALPFIKVWAIIPMAFLFTFILTRVSNKVNRERVFYVMMSIFILFFSLFTFVLYPFRNSLHPHELADTIQAYLPLGCKGLIAVFRNWTFTSFYVMSEMWSTIVMTILAWGFVNEVTSVKTAKRFYGLFGIAINLSSITAGIVTAKLSTHVFNPAIPFGSDGWGQSIFLLNATVILSGIIALFCFKYIHKRGGGYNSLEYKTHHPEEKIKMGMRKNFAYLAKSKYLIFIAIIVVTYNISINLIEVVWKDQVGQLYPNPSEFNTYMSKVLTGIGILAAVVSFFVSTLMRKFSWTTNAMIAPVILLSTGTAFFSFLLFKDSGLASFAAVFNSTPLALGVFFGSLQNCVARASKYTVFDATKELAFIPLSKECKLKGKAAIDGVGSRIGKSGGSLIHQGLLITFGTVALSTPFVAVILSGVIVAWMGAVRALGKQFEELTHHDQVLNVQDTEKAQPVVTRPSLEST